MPALWAQARFGKCSKETKLGEAVARGSLLPAGPFVVDARVLRAEAGRS